MHTTWWMGALLVLNALAQTGGVNMDFERGPMEAVPQGWFVPQAFQATAVRTDKGCKLSSCAELRPEGRGPGNLMQSIDAAPFRSKKFRFTVWVDLQGPGRVMPWIRVDRANGTMGFFDNSQVRPIMTRGWQEFHIDGFVHDDAEKIAFGVLTFGAAARLDEFSLTATGEMPKMTVEPARAIDPQGLQNLVAFTKLFGIVRHFHPSDEVALADWNQIAIDGVRRVEQAASAEELAALLRDILLPVAPTLRVYAGQTEPKAHSDLTPREGLEVIRWYHKGFGQERPGLYKSTRLRKGLHTWNADDICRIDLGQTVTALVPVALFADRNGTLPRNPAIAKADSMPLAAFSTRDRGTRLADIVLAWNVFQHFYPYFDVARVNWEQVLVTSLRTAAVDKGDEEFVRTLQAMVAKLKDGHGNVGGAGMARLTTLNARVEWIEGKAVVTNSTVVGLQPGDAIVRVNGQPVEKRIAELEERISGATERWIRRSAMGQLLAGKPNETIELVVEPAAGGDPKTVLVKADKPEILTSDPRPKDVFTELEPGICYFDLTRGTDKEFENALPKLETAKGIVFDMRGYPKVSPAWFSHVSKEPLRSAQWHVPILSYPGRMEFERGGEWNLQPKAPYLAAKRVFLTHGGAISYAESTMGIVEAYKLGEIIGEGTAGTNGNVNPFELPGGLTVVWTGMKVIKHDGTRHHGVGIAPTVPVSRTRAGVAAGRDEVLERGIAVLKAK